MATVVRPNLLQRWTGLIGFAMTGAGAVLLIGGLGESGDIGVGVVLAAMGVGVSTQFFLRTELNAQGLGYRNWFRFRIIRWDQIDSVSLKESPLSKVVVVAVEGKPVPLQATARFRFVDDPGVQTFMQRATELLARGGG